MNYIEIVPVVSDKKIFSEIGPVVFDKKILKVFLYRYIAKISPAPRSRHVF